jgi:hypothetical protein
MKTNKIVLSLAALAGLLAGLAHTPANASLVTVSGTNVDFIYDDSLLGMYGTPTISGNNLFFSPTQFRSSSLNGTGMSSASATTFIDIHAHDGYSFGSMALTEFGDYKLLGQNSFVNISGEALAIDKNNPPSAGPLATAFFNTSDNLSMRNGALHPWTATTQLDLTDNSWTDTTMVRVTLENMLDSYTSTGQCDQPSVTPQRQKNHSHTRHGRKSLPGEIASGSNCGAQQAFIEKKFSGLTLDMTSVPPAAVPLPSSFALFLPGLLYLLGFSARRQGL